MGAAEPRETLAQGGPREETTGLGRGAGPQPRAPACASQRTGLPAPGPSTMHLLCFLSLACSLLAAALIPGPREAPATVAAFESGLGFSEAEPDGGEVKVGAREPRRVGLRIRGSPSPGLCVGLALLGVQRTCPGECVHNYLFNLWIQS